MCSGLWTKQSKRNGGKDSPRWMATLKRGDRHWDKYNTLLEWCFPFLCVYLLHAQIRQECRRWEKHHHELDYDDDLRQGIPIGLVSFSPSPSSSVPKVLLMASTALILGDCSCYCLRWLPRTCANELLINAVLHSLCTSRLASLHNSY